MSTAGPLDPQPQPPGTFGFAGGALPFSGVNPSGGGMDPLLIQQTKNEIRALVQEITQLSRSAIPAEQFYEEFLRRVVSALAAQGGAVWLLGEQGAVQLHYQVNLPEECAADREEAVRHHLLVKNVAASGQATLVPPRSGSASGSDAGNPTDCLLVLAALKADQEVCGVVEVFQRATGGPTTQRGYLRFLVQMCELANEYLRNSRLRQLDDRQTLWAELERFLQRLHRQLDSQAVAYTLVNDGRRLIGCDRVSATVAHGRRHRVVAVSGLDAIDRRSADIKLLGRLVSVVCATGRPLWYSGPQRDIPPQIEKYLDAYIDRAHATLLAIIPLTRADTQSDREDAAPTTMGALVVEQLSSSRMLDALVERSDTVAQHGASALANALDHESLFLLPVWRALGKARWVVRARTLPKTLLVLTLLAALIAGLVCVPCDFDLSATGKLQPCVRRDVFAHTDGVVMDVPVRHEQIVEPEEVLARLSNTEIEVEIADLIGRQRATQERILSLQRVQLDGRRLRVEDQNRLAGELLELREVDQSIERELELLRQKAERLVVRSDMCGQVVTWDVSRLLLRRPVQKGQLLMTLLDLDGEWELELYMPERRMGHIVQAASRAGDGLPVTWLLASHPERVFPGRVVEIHRLAEVRGERGNCVLIRVAIDKAELPELRSETTVTARVHCGRRSVGFVWFHELIETLYAKVLFWF